MLNDVQYASINADGSLGTWQSTTSFNTGRLCHASVVYNGYLYVIQGFYYSAASPLTDVQFAQFNADGSLGSWQSTTSFSPARWGHKSIAYNGYVYSMGGSNWNGSYYTLNDVQYSLINTNGSLNNWQSTTSLNPSLDAFGLVEYNGYLLITGGIISAGYSNDVKFAMINVNGSLGTWQSTTSFNTPRAGHTSVLYNGYLYVIGGTDNTGNDLNDVQYAKINTPQNITDYDGNVYTTVKIGNQVWMAENLRSTHYSDGTPIPGVDANYNNANYVATYGRLYTWSAAMRGSSSSSTNPSGVQGVSPAGWHIPSAAEWNQLFDYLGGGSVAGGKLKRSGTVLWFSPNTGATNLSGFSALPGGWGSYLIGNGAYFWSATEYEGYTPNAYYCQLDYNSEVAYLHGDGNKLGGVSIRCVKDPAIQINHQPIADAGPDQSVNVGTETVLNGSGSSDPDNDLLTYAWMEGTTILGTDSQLAVPLSLGVHTITLTVDDGRGGTNSDTVVITVIQPNRTPVAMAGRDTTVEQTSSTGAQVTLDGSASSDEDGDVLTYTWKEETTPIGTGVKATVTLSVGPHTIVLTVDDGKGCASTDTVIINVVDTTPPIITVSSTPTVLWPANHKYITLNISKIIISVKDIGTPSISVSDVRIKSVSSDESENATGDGNTLSDIVISSDAKSVNLRSERQGGGNGRVYTINLIVKDASGNIGRVCYEVWVPSNKGDNNVINDGPAYTVEASSSLGKQVSELSIQDSDQPSEFNLYNNYPNPFNPTTLISFSLPHECYVRLIILNLLGEEVGTIVEKDLPAGTFSARWDASGFPSGVYFYKIQAGQYTQSKKMVLTK